MDTNNPWLTMFPIDHPSEEALVKGLEIQSMEPLKMSILDSEEFISASRCKEVTSNFITESATSKFHPDGLFSETIFGEIASANRLVTFGYINLNTKVFHPKIFKTLVRLKGLYGEVMSGLTYAKYDNKHTDLVRAESGEEGAGTGYTFFLKNFDRIKFRKTASSAREDKIQLIHKYKSKAMVAKWLVLPAGVRDVKLDDNSISAEEINKFYNTLLNYSRAIPKGRGESPVYDNIRYAIQNKVNEIEDYIMDILNGKTGYLQRKYAARSIALGTRNVISSALMTGNTIDDPKFLKSTEVGIPLFQCIKMFQHNVVYGLKSIFFNQIFVQNQSQISLINKKTLGLEYVDISEASKDEFMSSKGLTDLINNFRDPSERHKVLEMHIDKNSYYMFMVYDEGNALYILRDYPSFAQHYRTTHNKEIDKSKLRPLTYAELFYIVTYTMTVGKHTAITRYPAMYESSLVLFGIHLMSTVPSRTVEFYANNQPGEQVQKIILPEYPIVNSSFVDSTALHPSSLQGFGADFA